MSAYYNEFEPFAAAWLRELIKAGHIADGEVDERSIVDVRPEDLAGFTQCHFFAGIGGWSRALRLAGWEDERHVWTGSPPCQPFSTAGKQLGKNDERHLAPVWLELVKACKPINVFGEQVAAAVKKDNWLDDLQDSMEAENYATGSAVLPACSVGAPQLRQRLWFIAKSLAYTDCERQQRSGGRGRKEEQRTTKLCVPNELADTDSRECYGVANGKERIGYGAKAGRVEGDCGPEPRGPINQLADTNGEQRDGGGNIRSGGRTEPSELRQDSWTSPLHGSWGASDWLFCRDGKWRPVEPGTFPLVNGIPNRVGKLRGYGNAIVPEVAAEVIGAAMEIFSGI